MRVINRIVRELWRGTYKGNDIDHIEVKTDEMDPNASMEKRKTCNYRVSQSGSIPYRSVQSRLKFRW